MSDRYIIFECSSAASVKSFFTADFFHIIVFEFVRVSFPELKIITHLIFHRTETTVIFIEYAFDRSGGIIHQPYDRIQCRSLNSIGAEQRIQTGSDHAVLSGKFEVGSKFSCIKYRQIGSGMGEIRTEYNFFYSGIFPCKYVFAEFFAHSIGVRKPVRTDIHQKHIGNFFIDGRIGVIGISKADRLDIGITLPGKFYHFVDKAAETVTKRWLYFCIEFGIFAPAGCSYDETLRSSDGLLPCPVGTTFKRRIFCIPAAAHRTLTEDRSIIQCQDDPVFS